MNALFNTSGVRNETRPIIKEAFHYSEGFYGHKSTEIFYDGCGNRQF